MPSERPDVDALVENVKAARIPLRDAIRAHDGDAIQAAVAAQDEPLTELADRARRNVPRNPPDGSIDYARWISQQEAEIAALKAELAEARGLIERVRFQAVLGRSAAPTCGRCRIVVETIDAARKPEDKT